MSGRRKNWKQAGCYVWRTRKPSAPLGLPFIGRHTAYVGETSSRYHRDRQHVFGGGRYGHVAKMWADLEPKVYPLPCLFPSWKWSRKAQEKVWILLLWPVYNDQWNRWNPRRITLGQAERQRWARDKRMKNGARWRVNIGRMLARWAIGLTTLALIGTAVVQWVIS